MSMQCLQLRLRLVYSFENTGSSLFIVDCTAFKMSSVCNIAMFQVAWRVKKLKKNKNKNINHFRHEIEQTGCALIGE